MLREGSGWVGGRGGGLRTSYRDGIRARGERFSAHIRKESGNLVLVHVEKLRRAMFAGVKDVLPQQLLGDLAFPRGGLGSPRLGLGLLDVHRVLRRLRGGMAAAVGADDESG